MKRVFSAVIILLLMGIIPLHAQVKDEKEGPGGNAANHAIADPTKRPDQFKAGKSRKSESAPVLFLIGDSTMKNGTGTGEGKMWGWGAFFGKFFFEDQITTENHALGGRSSRTFITEGLWANVIAGIQKGDYLMVQFGHNDGGPLNTGRARASLKGIGEESQTVVMEATGKEETVYTFGHYMRQYIREAKAKGAIVIALSHTPGNRWTGNRNVIAGLTPDSVIAGLTRNLMIRCDSTYGLWTKQVAEQEGVFYFDMNDIIARKYEAMGQEAAAAYFADGVHTLYNGAILDCIAAIEGLKTIPACSLNKYVNPEALNTVNRDKLVEE